MWQLESYDRRLMSVMQVALLLYVASGSELRSINTIPSTLDTLSIILTVISLYDYVVTDFGEPSLLLSLPP